MQKLRAKTVLYGSRTKNQIGIFIIIEFSYIPVKSNKQKNAHL